MPCTVHNTNNLCVSLSTVQVIHKEPYITLLSMQTISEVVLKYNKCLYLTLKSF